MRLPRVIGHRGAAARAPENTLAGLRRAAELGVSWVEFDVRLTGDATLVLMHDDTLDRTTNGAGRVRAIDTSALRALDAGAWFAPEFAGELVPTFAEAVALLAELELGANVEIKAEAGDEAETGRAVAGAIRALWPAEKPLPLISSFQYGCAEAVAAVAPELPLAYLMDWSHREWGEQRDALPWCTIHCNQRRLTQARVATLKQAGLPVAAYTVNTAARAGALFGMGVDAVFSDCPDVLLADL